MAVKCRNGSPSRRLSTDEDRQFFSESGGACLLCRSTLFPDDPKRRRALSVAERAHVVAHSDDGPRADPSVPQELRDSPANLVLLCPTCHTIVDKDPEGYPAEFMLKAKRRRAEAVQLARGTPLFRERQEARRAAERLLLRNRLLFQQYGPDQQDGSTDSTEAADAWSERVVEEIIPNNRLLVALVDVNDDLATDADR